MTGLLLAAGLLALLLVITLWRLLHQWRRGRFVSGLAWSAQSLLMLALFSLALLVYSNLLTYQRLTHEAAVADIYLREVAPRKFQLSLERDGLQQKPQYFVLEGDQWQLDARIIKWKGWANLIGLDSYYQIERLGSRYSDIAEARRRLPTLYDLREPARGLDLWQLKQVLGDRAAFIDTLFGQGVFMPMVDGAHYRVTVGTGGLVVRAMNKPAREATSP